MSVLARQLRDQLAGPSPVVAPGVFDALSGLLATRAGFPAAYLSGASIAYTKLARPDLGFLGLAEVADVLATIRERVELPIIVDADTGFGNALNVARAVRVLEARGAAAIQLEDQRLPKRCGHLPGKTVVDAGEMIGKIHAATDARASDDTLIVARTDAVAVEGLEAAIERASSYAQAGADVLFVEAPRHRDQLAAVGNALGTVRPLLANMVEGGSTPPLPASELGNLGYRLVIFPGALVRVITHAAGAFLDELAATGTSEGFLDRMLDFPGLNALLGTPELMESSRRYESADGAS